MHLHKGFLAFMEKQGSKYLWVKELRCRKVRGEWLAIVEWRRVRYEPWRYPWDLLGCWWAKPWWRHVEVMEGWKVSIRHRLPGRAIEMGSKL